LWESAAEIGKKSGFDNALPHKKTLDFFANLLILRNKKRCTNFERAKKIPQNQVL
jgi:hypothetical protein